MAIWDAYVKIYDRLWVQKVSLGPTRRKVLEVLREHGIQGGKILDMSCGTGQLLTELQAAFPTVTLEGVEPSALGQVAVEKGHRVTVATIENLELSDRYDVILCTHAFPYYSNPQLAIQTLMQGLKTGGLLVMAHAHTENTYDRLMLALLKLTTSKANYPSTADMLGYFKGELVHLKTYPINAWYIPSIRLHVAQKRGL